MQHILMIATGGTIASSSHGEGLAPALTGEELAAYVPEAQELCDFDVVQPMNIDSTNMQPSDWLQIKDVIEQAYDSYDGFVVLHGTDTMAYTAAALSYLVQDSPKPIVLTGSQQPMPSPFTDARLNLYQALLYASDSASSNVSVVFGGSVIVGTRAHKQRTLSFNAFSSVNYPLPALIRNNRIIREGREGMTITKGPAPTPVQGTGILEPVASRPRFYNKLNSRVAVLKLTPGLTPHIICALKDSCDALILESFGIGGVPETPHASFKQAIFDWIDAGKTIVMTTQVSEEGLDLGVYEVGRAYAENPAILQAGDMTIEALVAKTMWALGETRDPARLATLFYTPINHDRIDAR